MVAGSRCQPGSVDCMAADRVRSEGDGLARRHRAGVEPGAARIPPGRRAPGAGDRRRRARRCASPTAWPGRAQPGWLRRSVRPTGPPPGRDDGRRRNPDRAGRRRSRALQHGLQRGVERHALVLPPPSLRRRPPAPDRPAMGGGVGCLPRAQPAVRRARGQGRAGRRPGPRPGLPPGPDGHELARLRPDLRTAHFTHTPFADPVGAPHAAHRGGRRAARRHGGLRRLRVPHRAVGARPTGPDYRRLDVAPAGYRDRARPSSRRSRSTRVGSPRRLPNRPWPGPLARIEERVGDPNARSSSGWTGWSCRRTCCAASGPSTSCSEREPDRRGRVVFVALAYPTRQGLPEYLAYQNEVESTVARINERWATPGWTPIVLDVEDDYHRSLAALTRYDVLLVNPVRDGLNLVAKEGPLVNTRHGVLALSREAGAFDELVRRARGQPVRRLRDCRGAGRALDMGRDERAAMAGRAAPARSGPPSRRLARRPARRGRLTAARSPIGPGRPLRQDPLAPTLGPARRRPASARSVEGASQARGRPRRPPRPPRSRSRRRPPPIDTVLTPPPCQVGQRGEGGQIAEVVAEVAGRRAPGQLGRTTEPLSMSSGGRSSTDMPPRKGPEPGAARSRRRPPRRPMLPASRARRQCTVTAAPWPRPGLPVERRPQPSGRVRRRPASHRSAAGSTGDHAVRLGPLEPVETDRRPGPVDDGRRVTRSAAGASLGRRGTKPGGPTRRPPRRSVGRGGPGPRRRRRGAGPRPVRRRSGRGCRRSRSRSPRAAGSRDAAERAGARTPGGGSAAMPARLRPQPVSGGRRRG